MIDVTKDLSGEQAVIDMNSGEWRGLVYLLEDYLADKDRNHHDGYYDDMKELYNKIKNA